MKDDGYQFVFVPDENDSSIPFQTFMIGFYNNINKNNDIIEMDDIKGNDSAYILQLVGVYCGMDFEDSRMTMYLKLAEKI